MRDPFSFFSPPLSTHPPPPPVLTNQVIFLGPNAGREGLAESPSLEKRPHPPPPPIQGLWTDVLDAK